MSRSLDYFRLALSYKIEWIFQEKQIQAPIQISSEPISILLALELGYRFLHVGFPFPTLNGFGMTRQDKPLFLGLQVK